MKTDKQDRNCVKLLNQIDKAFSKAIPTRKYNPIIKVNGLYQYKDKVKGV